MSTLAEALVTWDEFRHLPEPEDAYRCELHDGEVVVVPPASPIHILIQRRIQCLLQDAAAGTGEVVTEFPYRPHADLQFWFADVAYIPADEWSSTMKRHEYVPYAPPLIVEVLYPSNRETKLNKQRIVSMSAGTREFWVVNPDTQTVQVTSRSGVETYDRRASVPLSVLAGASVPVAGIFEGL